MALPDLHISQASNGWIIVVGVPNDPMRPPGAYQDIGRYVARSMAELSRTIARIYVAHEIHDGNKTTSP